MVFSSQSSLPLITTHCNTEDICVGRSVGTVSSYYLPYLFSLISTVTIMMAQCELYIILCPPLFELIGKATLYCIDDQLLDV